MIFVLSLIDDPGEHTNLASKEPALVEKIRAQMPEQNFSPYVQKGLPGVKLSPKINADNYDCLWDAGSGTAKGFNASLEYCKTHDHYWHLSCFLPKSPENDGADRGRVVRTVLHPQGERAAAQCARPALPTAAAGAADATTHPWPRRRKLRRVL